MSIRSNNRLYNFTVYASVILFSALCLYPFLLTVGISLSDEQSVIKHGFSVIPKEFSLETYKFIFENSWDLIFNGYRVTLMVTAIGTVLAMIVTTFFAYAISNTEFKYRNTFAFICYLTMILNAGLMPWYLFIGKYGIKETIWALILPYLLSPWNVFLLKLFFSGIPAELQESVKIDGGSHWTIFTRIMLPLALPGVVTVALFVALQFWNDWYLALLFVSDYTMQPLQYHLYNILSNIQFLAMGKASTISVTVTVPSETAKMATTCIAIGPIILLYPFVQRYFIKGLTAGAVKG